MFIKTLLILSCLDRNANKTSNINSIICNKTHRIQRKWFNCHISDVTEQKNKKWKSINTLICIQSNVLCKKFCRIVTFSCGSSSSKRDMIPAKNTVKQNKENKRPCMQRTNTIFFFSLQKKVFFLRPKWVTYTGGQKSQHLAVLSKNHAHGNSSALSSLLCSFSCALFKIYCIQLIFYPNNNKGIIISMANCLKQSFES